MRRFCVCARGQYECSNGVSLLIDFGRFENFERPFTRQTWLGSARNFAKTRFRRFPTFDFSTPKKKIGENFGPKISFFDDLAWFLSSHSRTDLKISFPVKFCFRYTYPEVCTTKNHQNSDSCGAEGGGQNLKSQRSIINDAPLVSSGFIRCIGAPFQLPTGPQAFYRRRAREGVL